VEKRFQFGAFVIRIADDVGIIVLVGIDLVEFGRRGWVDLKAHSGHCASGRINVAGPFGRVHTVFRPRALTVCMKRTRRAVVAGVGVGIAGLAGCTAPTESGRQMADSDYTQLYRNTVDSVVEIHVSDGSTQRGQGSGFVIDGAIITNHHVVDAGPDVTVQFSDRQWADATVVGSDPISDIAVLSVDDSVEMPAPLSFVNQPPPVGESVVAIGSPFDLSESLSQGIISGRNRSIPGPSEFPVPDTIQTDVALNPGNSGGPIVDRNGDVVGIVIANQGQTVGFAISAALATRVVPELQEHGRYEHSFLGISMLEVDPAVADANGLSEPGGLLVVLVEPDGPSDGVLEPSLSEADVEELPDDPFGDAPDGSPEAPPDDSPDDTPEAPPDDSPEGFPDDSPDEPSEPPMPPEGQDEMPVPTGGDVIIEFAGTAIDDSDTLSTLLALETEPGETVPLTVLRDGDETTVEVTLGSRTDA